MSKYVHEKGMFFGLHVMRGVPKQAVFSKCRIMGTKYTCDEIIKDDFCETDICSWLNHMYPIDMSKQGSYEYIKSLISLYESWEIDLLKIDDLSFPYHKDEIEAYSRAITESKREIIFSTSPGATPLSQGNHISAYADMWRISPDFWDDWESLYSQIESLNDWAKFKKSDSFPDGDMFPVSRISNYGPFDAPRYSNFTYLEKRTYLSVWAIFNSPIILGGDMSVIDQKTLGLLQNPYIQIIDAYAKEAKIAKKIDGKIYIEGLFLSANNSKIRLITNCNDYPINMSSNEYECSIDIWGNGGSILMPHDTFLGIV